MSSSSEETVAWIAGRLNGLPLVFTDYAQDVGALSILFTTVEERLQEENGVVVLDVKVRLVG